MAIFTEQQAKELLQKVISFSTADECQCNLDGSNAGNIRYARNTVTTAGETSDVMLTVQSSFDKRTGKATINEFDDAALHRVVARSEELARLAPENPEHEPNLGPAKYDAATAWFESTASVTPAQRAEAAEASIAPSRENHLIASGFLDDAESFVALMNKKGMFAYQQSSVVNFTATIRTEDGTGSGWVSRDYNDSARMDTREASAVAIQKSILSRDAKEMEPGKYTVIMEPAAAVQLLANMGGNMDQRAADEGRSFLSKKPKEGEKPAAGAATNRLGEKMFDERVTIYSDPTHPDCPTAPFDLDGYPVGKTTWIDQGVITAMPNTRYWAQKTGVEYRPVAYSTGRFFGNNMKLLMDGGDQSLEDLIKGTRRGVLVTRLWYIRSLDPQTLLYTGLTRDGTFYIEDGEIKYPIKNFRFNDSPIVMLNNIEALGVPQRINGHMIPPMKIRDFTFSSLSDAV